MSDSPFDRLIASTDPAMVVVTAVRSDRDRAGCLVGFHGQVSIEPERYGVWISHANRTHDVASGAAWLAVHFLTADDGDLARWFGTTTGDEVDTFADLAVTDGPEGLPVLDRCPNRIVGRVRSQMDGGNDHTCFSVEPVHVGATDGFDPLRLSAVIDLEPGHQADEDR